MADALTDLTTAVTRVGTDAANEIRAAAAALAAAVTGNGSVSAADVEAQVTALNATADALEADIAKLTPPTPNPVPVPNPVPNPEPPVQTS